MSNRPQPARAGTAPAARRAALARLPLALRMLLYAGSFLALALVGLPWAAYRIDLYRPGWHVEIGWWRAPGAALLLGCLAAYAWSAALLARRGRGAYVEFDPPRQLVVCGPFRRCRNPIAGSLLGMLLGEALLFSSTGIFLLFGAALPLAHLQVVLLEEPLLAKRFGPAYEEYLRRVPRWLPRLRRRGSAGQRR